MLEFWPQIASKQAVNPLLLRTVCFAGMLAIPPLTLNIKVAVVIIVCAVATLEFAHGLPARRPRRRKFRPCRADDGPRDPFAVKVPLVPTAVAAEEGSGAFHGSPSRRCYRRGRSPVGGGCVLVALIPTAVATEE